MSAGSMLCGKIWVIIALSAWKTSISSNLGILSGKMSVESWVNERRFTINKEKLDEIIDEN